MRPRAARAAACGRVRPRAARAARHSACTAQVAPRDWRRARWPQFNDALAPDGVHLSSKGNNLVHRMLKEHLDELSLGPRQLPPHRLTSHAEAYGADGCDNDGRLPRPQRRPR